LGQRFWHRLRRGAGLTVLLGLIGAGSWWWYATTRPDYRLRCGRDAVRRHAWVEAERYALLLETAGDRDLAHLLRGESLFRQGHHAQAVEELRQIPEGGEARVEAAALYGQWFLALKRPAEAEAALRYVLRHRPDAIDAHRGLATIYYDQGALLKAVAHCREWSRLDPADGRADRFAGFIYKELPPDAHLAIAHYQEALRRRLTPAVAEEVRAELAECYVKQGQYAQALEALAGCGPEVRETLSALEVQAEALWGLGRLTEAEALLEQACRRYPDSIPLGRFRAKALAARSQYAEAAAQLRRALELDPYDFDSLYQLAQAYERLGRTADAEAARRQLQQTQKLLEEMSGLVEQSLSNPWDAGLRERLAAVCERLDKPALAARWRRAAADCHKHGQ
jgi:tetratricopeptide (TPR) repeat protein